MDAIGAVIVKLYFRFSLDVVYRVIICFMNIYIFTEVLYVVQVYTDTIPEEIRQCSLQVKC